MPSGASITAKYGCYAREDCRLDIRVYPLAEDYENSEGLCGNFNGERDDDLTLRGSATVDSGDGDEPILFTKSFM